MSTLGATIESAVWPHWCLRLASCLALTLTACADAPAPKPTAADTADDAGPADSDGAGADVASGKCAVPAICDDGNPCTIDGCDPLLGCTLQVVQCNDGDPCTDDRCNLQDGTCTAKAADCDDANACTTGTCVAGEGCVFAVVDCTDGDACTSDGCSPQIGCQNAPLDCNDFLTCTTDTCEPGKGCVHTQTAPGKCCESATDCEDGVACTADTCVKGVCAAVALTSCCSSNLDCDDGNACTADSCVLDKGQCQWTAQAAPGCCQSAADCDDQSDCTADSCVEATCAHTVVCCASTDDCTAGLGAAALCALVACVDGGCSYQSGGGSCCSSSVYASGFDGDPFATDWLATPATTAQWSAGVGKSGPGLAIAPLVGQTIAGGGQTATARGPQLQLPLGTRVALQFDYQLTAAPGALRLRALTAGGSWLLWQAPAAPMWSAAKLDVSGLAGRLATRNLRLLWEFTPGASGGAAIDNLSLTADCTATACADDADCADDLGLSAETCVQGSCVFASNPAYCEQPTTCNDANPCTADACVGQSCSHTPVANCCLQGSACDDANPCTIDSCTANICQHQKAPASACCTTTADCDDGNPCTADTCPGVGLACAHTQTDPDCCTKSADCDDQSDCTQDSCVGNQCSHWNLCCSSNSDCDDGDPACTTDSCSNGLCQFTPTGAAGCCTKELADADFESGLAPGWVLTGSSTDSKWQVVAGKQKHSGNGALWYGNLQKGNFDDGLTNGTAALPALAFAADELLTLQFWVWMDTESGWFDDLSVRAVCGKTTLILWQKSTQLVFNLLTWTEVKVDLSALAGHTCTLQWYFDTLDGTANATEGVYLDDIALQRSCAKRACNLSADCNDGWADSSDQCIDGICAYTVSGLD